MRMSRSTITLSHSIHALTNRLKNAAAHKSRFVSMSIAATLVVTASILIPNSAREVHAARSAALVRQAAAQFLTLPFEPTNSMNILSGWYYSSSGGFHGGIDYINGYVDGVGSWRTFPVIA